MATPAWADPTTHVYAVGETVTAATLNTFVQQDIANASAYLTGELFYELQGTFTSNATFQQVGSTQTGIATFPEAYTMIVEVMGYIQPQIATANTTFLMIADETGLSSAPITIGQSAPGLAAYPVTATAANVPVNVCGRGKKNYAANANAGFSIFVRAGTSASLSFADLSARVRFRRGTI
jgi:hypothetical protein